MPGQYKLRRSALAGLALIAITTGAAAVPVCVNIYTHLPRHHSKATVARWKAWGKQHPNWKPAPRETLRAIQWDCGPMDLEISTIADNLSPVDAPLVPDTYFSYAPGTNPSTFTVAPVAYLPIPVAVEATPEPSALVLLVTGMFSLALFTRRK